MERRRSNVELRNWVVGAFIFIMGMMFSCTPTPRSTPLAPSLYFEAIDGSFRTSPADSLNIVSAIFDPKTKEVSLSCGRNETIGFYLLLQSPNTSHDRITLAADPLIGKSDSLDASAVEFFRAWFVELDKLPGWHLKAIDPQDRHPQVPDVLIPTGAPKLGQPYLMAQGQKLFIWIDLSIPHSAKSDAYSGAIRIYSGEKQLARVPLKVQVWPFVLPDELDVTLLGPLNLQKLLGHHLEINGEPFAPFRLLKSSHLYDESVGLIHRSLRLLLRHRVSPYLTGLYPFCKISNRGELIVNWEDYDQILSPFIDGNLYPRQPPIKYWPIPFDKTFPTPPPYDSLTSPRYTRNLRQYITLCSDHFLQQGWINKACVLLPFTDQVSEAAFRNTRSYGQIAQLAASQLPTVSFLPPQDLRPYGWEDYPYMDLSDYVGVWCPPAQFYDPGVFAQPQFREQKKWYRLDRPPFSGSIELAAADTFTRVIPWQAASLQADAVLLPEINNWTDDYTNIEPVDQISRTPPPLILPGKFCGLDEPIPTLRLKMLQRGMQDLAYLQLCREKGLHEPAAAVLRSLCRFAGADAYGAHFADGQFDGWQRDPSWWNYAHELLAGELTRQQQETQRDAEKIFESFEWQRFFEVTHQVQLKSNGVRVRLQPGPGARANLRFDIEFALTLMNYSRKPVWGSVSFGELPIGWTEKLGFQTFENAPPNSPVSLTLHAFADTIPAADDGTLEIPVVLQLTNQKAKTFWVRLSHISAQRVSKPINLDGDLSDWPIGVGNVVSNFSPISRGSITEGGATSRERNREVVGFVCADSKNLYLGFHLFTKDRFTPPQIQRNFLEYDDRIPTGGEVLEILIDPSNGRSSSPSNLYHIAIKPTGTAFEEHGIRTDPQLGYIENWSGNVEVVTQIKDNEWIAEIRVPIAKFGPAAKGLRTWGINFCRFDAASWTYTNWAGAIWNTYNPATLGNVSFAN